jgi:Fe-S-cluster-containing hydrogenase component 2
MQADEEGFVYPKVNQNECINCNLCDSVCPIINENVSDKPISVIAAKNMEDNVRKQSSSGGVFTALAER